MPRKKKKVSAEEVDAVVDAVVPSGETEAEPEGKEPGELAEPEEAQPEQHAYYRGERALSVMLKELNGRSYYEVRTNIETVLLSKEELDRDVTYA